MPKKTEISHKTIVFTVIFLILVWFLYYIRDIILEIFAALLIMTVLNPSVTRLSRKGVPRSLSVIVVYIIMFGVFGIALGSIVPSLIDQTGTFINKLPQFLNNLGISVVFSDQLVQQLISQLGTLPARIGKVVVSLFSNLLGLVTVLVFAFYLLSARDKLDDQLGVFVGPKRKEKIGKTIDMLEDRLGGWARAELVLMFIVGLANYVGLKLLGIPFALPLAILAGLLEIVPYAGPILAAFPAVIIGLSMSPILGIATAALAFLIQQLENYVLVPKIMQKNVGVNPIVTLLSLAIGFRLAGVVGILIAVPLFLTIQLLAEDHLLNGID